MVEQIINGKGPKKLVTKTRRQDAKTVQGTLEWRIIDVNQVIQD